MQKICTLAARCARSTTYPIAQSTYLVTCASSRAFASSTFRWEDAKVRGTVGEGAAAGGSQAATTPSAGDVVEGLQTLEMPEGMNDKETEIWCKLRDGLGATKLEVQDVSGGCGSMYAIDIQSEAFRGLNMLKQQRLVNQTIGEEIKGWHGVQLRTKAP